MPAAPSPRFSAAPARVASRPPALAGLGNRFVEVLARRLPADEFADEVCRLVVGATRAKAAAVLLYDRRQEYLNLLGHRGLDRAARAALGDGAACAWDIPIRGLRNRRISVISAAERNPFVPRPLVALVPPGLAIVSLPIYHEWEPIGVLLLVGPGAYACGDAPLQTLSQTLRVCASGLRVRGPAREPAESDSQIVAELATRSAAPGDGDGAAAHGEADARGAQESAVGVPPLPEAAARVWMLEQRLVAALEEIRRGREKLTAFTTAANAVVRDRDRLIQRLAEVDQARDRDQKEFRAEIESLQDRLLAVESERGRLQRLGEGQRTTMQRSLATLQEERVALLERTQAAEATATESQAALSALRSEYGRLQVAAEAAAVAQHVAQEELAQADARFAATHAAVEAERDRWRTEAETARAECEALSGRLSALDGESRARAVARDAAAVQLRASRDEIERLVVLAEEAQRQVTQVDSARAVAAADAAGLRRSLDEARTQNQQTVEELRAKLAATRAEATDTASVSDRLRAELATVRRGLTERDERTKALREEVAAGQQAATRQQAVEGELRTEVATLTARLTQALADIEFLTSERAETRASMALVRQQSLDAERAAAAAIAERTAETQEVRRQAQVLVDDKAALASRLEQALEEAAELQLQVTAAQAAAALLHGDAGRRNAALEAANRERDQLTAQAAALETQLRLAQEAHQATAAHSAGELANVVADRDQWKAQAEALAAEVAAVAAAVRGLQEERAELATGCSEATAEAQRALAALDSVSQERDELARSALRLEAAHAQAVAETETLRHGKKTTEAERTLVEATLRESLEAARAEAEQFSAEALTLRHRLGDLDESAVEREQTLTALHAEVAALRQQLADRGDLARQTGELSARVHDLERQVALAQEALAVAAGDRAVLDERLGLAELGRADADAASERSRVEARTAIERLTVERDAARAQLEERLAQFDARAVELAGAQAALSESHAAQQATAAYAAAIEARLHDAGGHLQEHANALVGVRAEREQFEAQLAAVGAERDAHVATLAVVESERDRERVAFETERLAWVEQSAVDRGELERLATTAIELRERLEHEAGARQTAEAEGARLRRAAVELEAARDQLQGRLANMQRLVSEMAALREQLAEREILAQRATELSGRAETLESALAAAREDSTNAARRRAELAKDIVRLRQQRAQAHEATAREQAAAREALQRLADERRRADAERAELGKELATQRAVAADLQDRLEGATSARASFEADVHRQVDDVQTTLRDREAFLAAAAAERERLVEALRGAEVAAVALAAERDDWRHKAQQAAHRFDGTLGEILGDGGLGDEFVVRAARDEPSLVDLGAPLVIERSVPLEEADETAIDLAAPEAEPLADSDPVLEDEPGGVGELVLCDGSACGAAAEEILRGAGFAVSRVVPSEALVSELAGRKVGCILLNLALGPAPWRTLKLLREHPETQNVPVLAYLMGTDRTAGFCFGRADFAVWPAEVEQLSASLARLKPKHKRLLVVSADIDGMSRLRVVMGDAGVAITSVLDGRQAMEFATVADPDIAMAHLSYDCPGVARAVVGLRASEATREMPLLVLLDKAAAREDSVFAQASHELLSKGTFQFAGLVGELAKLLT